MGASTIPSLAFAIVTFPCNLSVPLGFDRPEIECNLGHLANLIIKQQWHDKCVDVVENMAGELWQQNVGKRGKKENNNKSHS
mmetsp:Transcript_148150/g.258950  ORF Transcript_148150/g.258950 Transcript_148150/m.258950 type:complete len:82 (+) Transcript_148150:659-904(+)